MSGAMTTKSSSGPGPGMKICPYCAEEIREAAVKCRYCQSDLTGTAPGTAEAPPPPPPSSPTPMPSTPMPSTPMPSTSTPQTPAASAAGVDERSKTPRASLFRRPTGEEKPAKGTAGRETAATRFPVLARPVIVVVLAVLVLALLVVNGLLLLGWHGYRQDADARSSGQVSAVNDIEKILSYDYRSFDKGTKTAEALMTPKFKKKYADTVAAVRADARPTKAVVKAQVVASSVISAKKDQVKALLFVNQTTTRTNLSQPRVDLNRVEVTLVKKGDDWLVDNIQAL
jgi:hypothetical protein